MIPELVAKDDTIDSESQAESEMQAALKELMGILKEYNLPFRCS